MEISERSAGPITILDVTGEVDFYTTRELQMAAQKLISLQKTRILINFGQAPYVASSGLGTLLYIQRELKKVSGMLKLTGFSPALYKVFQITRLDDKFHVFQSEKDALSSFGTI